MSGAENSGPKTRSMPTGPPKKSRYVSRAPGQSVSGGKGSKNPAASKMAASRAGRQAVPELVSTAVLVHDDFGNDVTPKSLLPGGAVPLPGEPGSEQSSQLEQLAEGVSSTGSGGGSGRSGPEAEETAGTAAESAAAPPAAGAEEAAAEEEAAPLTEEQLDEQVVIELAETGTFWLFDEPGTCVAMDSPLAAPVTAANAEYEALLQRKKDMADLYVERAMQTFNGERKQKEVQTAAGGTADAGSQATVWEIHDANEGVAQAREAAEAAAAADAADAATPAVGGGGDLSASVARASASMAGASASIAVGTDASASFSASANPDGSGSAPSGAEAGAPAGAPAAADAAAAAAEATDISQLPRIAENLRVMERMVLQNTCAPPPPPPGRSPFPRLCPTHPPPLARAGTTRSTSRTATSRSRARPPRRRRGWSRSSRSAASCRRGATCRRCAGTR